MVCSLSNISTPTNPLLVSVYFFMIIRLSQLCDESGHPQLLGISPDLKQWCLSVCEWCPFIFNDAFSLVNSFSVNYLYMYNFYFNSMHPLSDWFVPAFYFSQNRVIVYSGFLVFEVCVGIFWPSMSTMRGKYVPEESECFLNLTHCRF